VSRIAARFKRVVQRAENFGGFDVDRVLLLKLVLLVAGNEGEGVDVFVKFGERKLNCGDAAIIKQRQTLLVFRFQVVQCDAVEIRNDDVTGNFFCAAFAHQVLNVAERLRFGLAQILASGFVFHQDDARPEQVNIAVVAGNLFHRLFKAGNRAARHAEDLKKFIPESLLLRAFAFCARPIAGKLDRVVTDFIPGNRHEAERSKSGKHGARPVDRP
jgi:hypothetical protein